ncbi:uncharacterized protein LOC142890189 isoform X2 [Nelusetta ayraudi]|uniref:uncharacterized protein LOC142890189 isoform X2 n=1 Tax=Nelusetta ayraudi TaxID=303726 RepID=UPI003F722925
MNKLINDLPTRLFSSSSLRHLNGFQQISLTLREQSDWDPRDPAAANQLLAPASPPQHRRCSTSSTISGSHHRRLTVEVKHVSSSSSSGASGRECPACSTSSPAFLLSSMALEDTVAAGRRLDLGSLFCLIGRHGPAVLLAAAGIAALLVALLIYRSLRGRRWWRRGAAVSPGTEPGHPECEAEVQPSRPEEELQSGESTDAKSDEVPPELTEEIDGIESNLKVRQRRRRRRQVPAAPEEKKPPPPSSPPPPTPAPVQQLPEEAGVEPEEPENPPQELGKLLAADRQEDVTADQDVTEMKVQCPANKQAPQRDQAATVEEHSEQPSKESSEEPSDRPSEEPSEEPNHQLGAVPPPAVTSNLAERLDKEDLESVAPRGDVHLSAKEDKEEDRQRLEDEQEEEEKKEEKEVQEDAPPMENLPLVIPTTRDDVQDEDQGPTLKEHHDEAPAEGFWSQTSQLDLQNQVCNPPFEPVAEELLTSYVVVDSDSPVQISGADKCPDWSPASDHTEAPSPAPLAPSAPPAPPLNGDGHFTALEPETLPSCESEDQSSWTGEPPETPDRLVLVSDILDTKSEASDLRPAVAGSGGFEKKEEEDQEEEKEEAKVEAASAEGEPHPEMFPSVQEPKGHDQEEELLPDSTQEEELLPDSTQEEELLPDSAQEEELLPDSAQEEEELLPYSTQEEELLPDSAQEEEELLPNSAQKEELLHDFVHEVQLLPDSTQEEELLLNSAQEEELLPDSVQEVQLLPDSAQDEELRPDSAQEVQLLPDFAQEVQLLPDSGQEEELLPNSTQGEELLSDFAQEEELHPDSVEKEELPTDATQEEGLLPDSVEKEELPTDATQEEGLLPDSKQEEKLPPNSAEEEEDLLHDSDQKKELLCDSTQAEELPPESAQEDLELPPDCVQDDITPPVTAVSWWSSEGRDPAPGDWIMIPEFAAAENEDMFGHQVESEYHRLMDHFVAQVEESLKFAVEVIEGEGGEKEEEVEKKKAGEEEQEEQERRRTEISIMEATMDANEWVTDLGQQLLPWLSVSAPELPEESSASCGGGGPTPRVAAVPPLLPQTVEVTFRVHYLTWSEQQTLAITGSRPELGGWTAFVPLEREGKGGEKGEEPGEGRGLWSGRVHLPAHSRLEWKFAVLDKGRVIRWEECRNRVLDTGDQDQLVHGWWGRE